MTSRKNNSLIAIGGFKGVGKDTVAEMLQYLLNTPKLFHSYWLFKLFGSVNGKWKITSFAHPLKRTLAAMLNIDIKRFEDRDFKENTYINFSKMDITKYPPAFNKLNDGTFNRCLEHSNFEPIKTNYITIRQLMQCWGTNTMRQQYGDRLWILLTLINNNPTIISDLRFKTEAKEIKDRGGKLIYINRPGYTAGKHISEQEVFKLQKDNQFDITIDNSGSLKDLFNYIKKNVINKI